MDRKQIIYVVVGIAILIGVVYLLKYSGGKSKKDETDNDEEVREVSGQAKTVAPVGDERNDAMGERESAESSTESDETDEGLETMTEDVVIKPGDTGSAVSEIQRRLQGYDVDVRVTGEYDEQTTEALSHIGLSGEVSLYDVPDLDGK